MNKGQAIVEYAIILALIILVVVGVLMLLGVSINNVFNTIMNVF